MISTLVALTVTIASQAGSSSAVRDPLWDAAVATVGRSDLVPQAAIVATTKPAGGGAASRTETWVTFRLDDGELESTIVYRREGRKVLTHDERARRNRLDTRLRRAAPFRIDEIPLQPHLQSIVRYRRTAVLADRVAFEFTMRRGGHELVGTVFIAPDGQPLEIEFVPRPLPFGVRSIRSSLRLASTTNGRVQLHSMTVRGSAGVLWMDRPFRTEYRFVSGLPHAAGLELHQPRNSRPASLLRESRYIPPGG